MIKKDPVDPRPFCGLAQIALDHDNLPKALELFEKAQSYGGQAPFYKAEYAKALSIVGRKDDAMRIIDTIELGDVTQSYTADRIGVIYNRAGFHEKAIVFFEKAADLDSQNGNLQYNLAASLQFQGKFERAEAHYKRAVELDPNHFRARASLASLKKQTAEDNNLATLISEFDRLKTRSGAALNLGHAIAKTLEDMGEYEESLTWLHKAKQLKCQEVEYNIDTDLAFFRAAKGSEVSASDSADKSQAAPIFIVGLPRTGTTLVDRIISSHSDVISAGELGTFSELIKRRMGSGSHYVLDAPTFKAARHKSITQTGYDYIKSTQKLVQDAPRFTDKMPLNFFNCGLIHRTFPNARIVALRRGAMDSCLSNYRQLFATEFSYYAYSLRLEDIAKYYRAFDDLMAYWRQHLPEDRFMEIHYEDIVQDQVVQTRRLLEFCDLTWQENCLRFHENHAPVATASSVQVRRPLYSGSIGRWRRYGDKLEGLKQALGDLAS